MRTKKEKIRPTETPVDAAAAPQIAASPGRVRLVVAAVLAVYAAALIYQREAAPPGMNNDVAEEALRGLYLVEGHHFEVMTFAVGNSAETLFLYLVGAAAQLFGTTTLAIQLVSWSFGLACIWLVWRLSRSIAETVPPWIPLLVAATSIWLFHYSRSGLRAITAPFFLAVFALLLERAERRPEDRYASFVCGVVLGLSIYGYTSTRMLPLAFLAYAAFRLIRDPDMRRVRVRLYATVAAGAAVASIPNLVFFVQHPKEFLSRGDYVLAGRPADYAVQMLWSALLPLYYPGTYRHIQMGGYRSDGVTAGLTSAGHNPVHIVIGIAFLLGLVQFRRYLAKPAAVFLVCTWIVALLTLGIAGPSATRLMILLPVYLVFAALGFGWILETRPNLRIPVLVVLLALGVREGYSYFSYDGKSMDYRLCYDPAPLAIGERAEALAAEGKRVLCVVSRDYSVVNYTTHTHSANVKIVEFTGRSIDPTKIPFNEFRPDILLLQNAVQFRNFAAKLPVEWRVGVNDRFFELRPVAR